jgi:integrase
VAQQDSKSGHVRLVERKRGPKWYARTRVNGRETMRLIGPAWLKRARPPEGYFTRQMAEVELQKIMDGANRRTSAVLERTFGEACAEWLRYLEQEKQSAVTTLRDRRSAVNARLVPFFGENTVLPQTGAKDIDGYRVHALVEKGLSPSTVQCDLTNLSGIFSRAKRLGWITANPYDDAERVKVTPSGDFNVLTVAEVEATARAAGATGAIIRVAAYTGLRQGELRALRWRDIDFANATVHVRRNLPAHGDEKAPKSKIPLGPLDRPGGGCARSGVTPRLPDRPG